MLIYCLGQVRYIEYARRALYVNCVLSIKKALQNKDRWVILELINKEDKSIEGSGIDGETNSNKENKSREGSRIDKENNGYKEDKSKEGSRIDKENNSKNKDNQGFSNIVLLLQQNYCKY